MSYWTKDDRQYYQFEKMLEMRSESINKAKGATFVGIVLGTLGRQGSLNILEVCTPSFCLCLGFPEDTIEFGSTRSEVHYSPLVWNFPWEARLVWRTSVCGRVVLISLRCSWIQIACPRLSIDWGYAFTTPLLNPYEAEVAFGEASWSNDAYPMDFYANDGKHCFVECLTG